MGESCREDFYRLQSMQELFLLAFLFLAIILSGTRRTSGVAFIFNNGAALITHCLIRL
jgi:hypothetical protein